MKLRFTILAVLLSLSAVAAQAQWGVGFKVGANMTTVSQPDFTQENFGDITPSVRFTGGMIVGYTANSFLDLGVELLFTAKGHNQDGFTLPKTPNIKHGLSITSYYTEIPLMLKFYPVRKLGLNIQVGPQIGILVYRYRTSDKLNVNYQYDAIRDEDFNIGLNAGIGYEKASGVFADLRYTHSLSKMYRHDHMRRPNCEGFKERSVSLSVGYKF